MSICGGVAERSQQSLCEAVLQVQNKGRLSARERPCDTASEQLRREPACRAGSPLGLLHASCPQE